MSDFISALHNLKSETLTSTFQLSQKEQELNSLKKQNEEYKTMILNLEKELNDLKKSYMQASKSDKLVKVLQEQNESLEKELVMLKEELVFKERNFSEQVKDLEFKMEKEINNYKNILHNMVNKMESAHSIERLSDMQADQIILLEDEIRRLKGEGEDNLIQKQLKHEMKFTDLKRKMMEHIKETQKNVTQLNLEHMDVSTKLTLLQNHQLLIELEYQSQQIEDLLKKKESLEKKVFELHRDIEVHKEVEAVLVEKNKKLSEAVKNLANNENNSTIHNNDMKQNSSILNINKNVKEFNQTENYEKKLRKFESILENKENEMKLLKLNCDSLHNKISTYEKKNNSVFNLFEEGLKKVCEDPELKKAKEIYINVESVRDCDFSMLTAEQKYAVLIIFMKHMMPLVNQNNIGAEFAKNNVNGVKMRYHFSKKYNDEQILRNKMSQSAQSGQNTAYSQFTNMRRTSNQADNLVRDLELGPNFDNVVFGTGSAKNQRHSFNLKKIKHLPLIKSQIKMPFDERFANQKKFNILDQ
jgi:hypothetical protein